MSRIMTSRCYTSSIWPFKVLKNIHFIACMSWVDFRATLFNIVLTYSLVIFNIDCLKNTWGNFTKVPWKRYGLRLHLQHMVKKWSKWCIAILMVHCTFSGALQHIGSNFNFDWILCFFIVFFNWFHVVELNWIELNCSIVVSHLPS